MKAQTTTSLSVTQLAVGLLPSVLATIMMATVGLIGILIAAVLAKVVAAVRAARSNPSLAPIPDRGHPSQARGYPGARPALTGLLS